MKKIFCITIVVLFLVSCAPSQSQIEKAIAETQAAMPSDTPTPQPTSPLKPTSTKTQAPTNSPTSEVFTTEEYLSLVVNRVNYYCNSLSEIKNCSVKISYSGKDNAVLVEIEANDMETVGNICNVLLPQSFKDTREAYVKTQMFRPSTLIVFLSDGQTTEDTHVRWSTVEDYLNDITDHSVLIFELITNRYIGK